jgi:predicted NAD-dependent protein-ADP-ribosyltransferase YbiA (DUF1768 family)
MIDIGSKENNTYDNLSNFTEFHFYFDGIFCKSMEGLLQSFKFNDFKKQKEICLLIGKKAKFKGKKKKWYLEHKLYWNNVEYDRFGKEYQLLLDKAFISIYKNNDYKKLVLSTDKNEIKHSMGKNDRNFTILTEDEFCNRLKNLRDGLL